MADEASDFTLGKKLFSSAVPPCGICHTLKDAESEGAVGPILDELKTSKYLISHTIEQVPFYDGIRKKQIHLKDKVHVYHLTN